MLSPQLIREKEEIDTLFDEVNTFPGDLYAKSLLTYYLCIRISGFVENCVRIIFSEYSATRAQDQVKVFVSSKLERFPNPTYNNIIRITREFNRVWAQAFRNAIAHGGVSGISVGQLANYYADVVQMIETLETSCV
jgi:hypothetical protein